MPPLPPYLIFITLFLVVIPSLVTIFLRISLYRYLINLNNKIQKLIQQGVKKDKDKEEGELKIIQILKIYPILTNSKYTKINLMNIGWFREMQMVGMHF